MHLAILLRNTRQVFGHSATHRGIADNFPVHSDNLCFPGEARFPGSYASPRRSTLYFINGPVWPEGQHQPPPPPPTMHPNTIELSRTELFQHNDPFASWEDRIRLSYTRAKAVGKLYSTRAVVWNFILS